MVLNVDDWTFVTPQEPGSVVAVDLFLDNGQHGRLEVFPLYYLGAVGEQIPEIIVYSEMPGEKLNSERMGKRWISRPPDKSCEWSHVELAPALVRQINDRLMAAMQEAVQE
ncbi:MAG: hypothetical protein AB1705_15955 [Verrucomicrobiota bacterium]